MCRRVQIWARSTWVSRIWTHYCNISGCELKRGVDIKRFYKNVLSLWVGKSLIWSNFILIKIPHHQSYPHQSHTTYLSLHIWHVSDLFTKAKLIVIAKHGIAWHRIVDKLLDKLNEAYLIAWHSIPSAILFPKVFHHMQKTLKNNKEYKRVNS